MTYQGFYEIQSLQRKNSDLKTRLDFLERLLRENQVHDFACDSSIVARHNARGQSYMYPQPCNCWLAPPEPDPQRESNDYREFYELMNLTPPTES